MSEIHPAAASGFATAADAYERGRPGYPEEAMAWVAERLRLDGRRDVLDLAAGTGKLTRALVPFGARVIAIEPIDEMREQLFRALPDVDAFDGTAESIPLPDGSVDAVTCGQAFTGSGPRRPCGRSTACSARAAVWRSSGTCAMFPIRSRAGSTRS